MSSLNQISSGAGRGLGIIIAEKVRKLRVLAGQFPSALVPDLKAATAARVSWSEDGHPSAIAYGPQVYEFEAPGVTISADADLALEWTQRPDVKLPSTDLAATPLGGSRTSTLTAAAQTVELPALGAQVAVVRIEVTGNFVGVLTPEVKIRGQWVASAYVERTDLPTANPATTPTITAGVGTYDFKLPGDCTDVRVRDSTHTSGSATVKLTAAVPYVPGVPVTAVLFDAVSAVNTTLDVGTLETGGWSSLQGDAVYSGATPGSVVVREIDDAGATSLGNSFPVTTWSQWMCGPGLTAGPSVVVTSTFGAISYGPVRKRMGASIQAVAAQTGRIRIEARR